MNENTPPVDGEDLRSTSEPGMLSAVEGDSANEEIASLVSQLKAVVAKKNPSQKDRAISADILDKIQSQSISISERSERFSGPIPPRSSFEGYERILPGAANRILSMAEKEQNHRIY